MKIFRLDNYTKQIILKEKNKSTLSRREKVELNTERRQKNLNPISQTLVSNRQGYRTVKSARRHSLLTETDGLTHSREAPI